MENKKSERNYAIDFFRIVFTLIVCWHHFQFNTKEWIHTGWLSVEFFFILSGFYLYKNFKDKEQTTLDYTKDKIRKMYPHYIFSFMMIFILCTIKSIYKNEFDIVNLGFKGISEILFLQGNGIFLSGINYPLWYVGTLIVGGFIVYECLKQNEKIFLYIILPIGLILFIPYVSTIKTGLETFHVSNGIYIPFFRGVLEIGLGCLVSNIFYKFNDSINNLFKKKLLYIFEIITYIMAGYLIYNAGDYVNYSLLIFSLIIVFCNCSNSLTSILFNRNIFKGASKLTYAMYLNHAFIITLLCMIVPRLHMLVSLNHLLYMIIYMILVIVYSMITNKFIGYLTYRSK